jgi:hypothetical protein
VNGELFTRSNNESEGRLHKMWNDEPSPGESIHIVLGVMPELRLRHSEAN